MMEIRPAILLQRTVFKTVAVIVGQSVGNLVEDTYIQSVVQQKPFDE